MAPNDRRVITSYDTVPGHAQCRNQRGSATQGLRPRNRRVNAQTVLKLKLAPAGRTATQPVPIRRSAQQCERLDPGWPICGRLTSAAERRTSSSVPCESDFQHRAVRGEGQTAAANVAVSHRRRLPHALLVGALLDAQILSRSVTRSICRTDVNRDAGAHHQELVRRQLGDHHATRPRWFGHRRLAYGHGGRSARSRHGTETNRHTYHRKAFFCGALRAVCSTRSASKVAPAGYGPGDWHSSATASDRRKGSDARTERPYRPRPPPGVS